VERSAQAAAESALALGLADELAGGSGAWCSSPCTPAPPPSPDAALVADCDMALLGWSEETFADSYARVRAERRWMEEKLFAESHKRFCTGLLARPRIYLTEFFRLRYEAQARANLERELRDSGRSLPDSLVEHDPAVVERFRERILSECGTGRAGPRSARAAPAGAPRIPSEHQVGVRPEGRVPEHLSASAEKKRRCGSAPQPSRKDAKSRARAGQHGQ